MASKGKKKKAKRRRNKKQRPAKAETSREEAEEGRTPVREESPDQKPPEKEPEPQPEPPEEVLYLEETDLDEQSDPEITEERKGLLKRGMSRSRKILSRPFTKASVRKTIDPQFWSDAEEALIAADTGVVCATDIVEGAKERIISEGIRDLAGLREAFREEVVEKLESFGSPPPLITGLPSVIFIAGVNGVGKTTTAAKIGYLLQQDGKKVIFAAADTFRAAGIEQMEMWANRIGAPVVRHQTGGDPAAVVYDAIESGMAKGVDAVLVDTAGRLHTKKNLMEELAKMWRVADREIEGDPAAVLVIDATTGQNGVAQARVFGEALDVSSIALTKMDGSAKGGVVMAIGKELGIPVAYIGFGEGMSDLRPFDPREYAEALF